MGKHSSSSGGCLKLIIIIFMITSKAFAVVYGTDDRREIKDLENYEASLMVGSAVALVEPQHIQDLKNGTFALNGKSLGEFNNLCSNEPFREQTAAAFCTGFLIAPGLVMTAAHCVGSDFGCRSNARFVFSYQLRSDNSEPTVIAAADVYSCKRLVARQTFSYVDPYSTSSNPPTKHYGFSIVELDRPVQGHKPFHLKLSKEPQSGQAVATAGYPQGGPEKYVGEGKIRSVLEGQYFFTNLDIFNVMSGSPVFDAKTLEVMGIVEDGVEDWVSVKAEQNTCHALHVCPQNGCVGEMATSILRALPTLPQDVLDYNK
jgi:V8-like Glu-specific endopeptidase